MLELLDTPKHADLIYDVGMHKGEDTEFYLRKGFRVIGIEADPDLVIFCREKFETFVKRGQLTIVEGAISSSDGCSSDRSRVVFYRNQKVSVWGTVHASWADRNARCDAASDSIEVDVIDFASIIAKHGLPYYMKIDIEGCDMVCVTALRRFRERPNYLSIESDKASFANIEREIDTLVELGYHAFQAVEQSGIPQLQTPPCPAKEGEYVSHRFEPGSSGLFGLELAGNWQSEEEVRRHYRAVRLGYYLVGDYGIFEKRNLQWVCRPLRYFTERSLRLVTKAAVPGWYDTHARHSQ